MSYAIMKFYKKKKSEINQMEKINKRINIDFIVNSGNKLNYDLIPCSNYMKKIKNEINERYKVNRKIRKDTVFCTEFIFTSDKNFFETLKENEEKLFFEKSLEFVQNLVDKKNILFATVYKDIEIPEIHIGFIPLTQDGRLSFKSFICGRKSMVLLQDNYYKFISQYFPQLERGKSAQNTRAKQKEFLFDEIRDLKEEVESLKNEINKIKSVVNL